LGLWGRERKGEARKGKVGRGEGVWRIVSSPRPIPRKHRKGAGEHPHPSCSAYLQNLGSANTPLIGGEKLHKK